MANTTNLYEQFWAGKRYLRKLTCKGECTLSHPERLVLSYFVYKARNKKWVLNKNAASDLGLDRRTISSAIKSLMNLRFLVQERRRYRALDPTTIEPDWFPAPHERGDEWWQRVRTYRHYLLDATARRSRGNRCGRITESDNAILWLLYSFGKGNQELIGQRVSGLANALGMSPNTVRAALARLSGTKLIMTRSDGFTLLEPDDSLRSWWRDSKKKHEASTQEEAGALQLVGEVGGERLVWIVPLVAKRFGRDPENQRYLLARMLRMCCDEMFAGQVKLRDMREYWEEVLDFFPDSDQAWDFCNLTWRELWRDAHDTHASNGKYSGSCIKLLTTNTRTRVSSPRNGLMSLVSK